MNGMQQTLLVARREIRERGRSRAFVASLVLMVVCVGAVIVLPGLLDRRQGVKDVGLTGDTPAELTAVLEAQSVGADTTIRVRTYETPEEGEAGVRDGEIDVLLVDARQLEWRTRTDEQLKALIAGAMQLVTVGERAAQAGLSRDEFLALVEPVPISDVVLGHVAGRSPDDETAAFIMSLLLFWAISTYGAMVMTGVVEEKSSRTVEVLLARIPARSLLTGKIAGIGLLGLAQIAATAAVALVAAALVESVDIPAVRGGVVAWAVVWFLLGYILYTTVFGTLGSLASRTEDASSATGPVMIVLVLGFMVSFAAIGSADTAWAQVISWIPLTAPLAMPNRIAMGAATWWEPVVAGALTILAIAGLVVLGGRVYTRAILHTGARIPLMDAWRGVPVRVQSKTATTNPSAAEEVTTAMNTPTSARHARQRVAITVIAIMIGAAVFVSTGDFVIALAVGAALIALIDQIIKAWDPAHNESPTSQDSDHEKVGR